jgi:hypothetical protein
MLIRQTAQLPSQELLGGPSNNYQSVKQFMDSCWTLNNSILMAAQSEALIDSRLEAGDVQYGAGIGGNQQFWNGRQAFSFNHVRPLGNMVSGMQRDNRKSLIVEGLENADDQTSDQYTKVLYHIFKKTNFDDLFSEAFHQGAFITGMNLMQMYLDFSDDPIFGDIRFKNLSFNQYFIDPYFRNKDLSDCNFVWVRNYMTHGAAAELLPEHRDHIMSLSSSPGGIGSDGKFQYMPQNFGVSSPNLVAYDEFYYRDYRTRKIMIDRNTGQFREIHKEEIDTPQYELFMAYNPQIEVQDQTIGTVRMAIQVQDRVFYDGPNPFNIDDFPFVPVIGFYNPMLPDYYNRLQGMCRSLRDPQMLMNRRKILSLDLLESVANSGYIFKEGAVVDIRHLYQTGQGRIIPLKDTAQMTDIQPIIPPQIPPSYFTMDESLANEMNMVTGISQENLGLNVTDVAGVLAALRQKAGTITLKPLFDNADFSLKTIGNRVMDMVSKNYGPMKVKNILEGEEPAPQFYNKAFGKYHCIVEEGFNTSTQKQMQFLQMVQLREMGIAIPDHEMIEAASIQNKSKLVQSMQAQQQQAQQMQMQQAQLQMQQAQAQIELTKSRAIADQGLGLERVSRVDENKALAVERRAQAERDEEEALLSFVKSLKEIQDLDMSTMQKFVAIAHAIKDREQIGAEKKVRAENTSNAERGMVR